MEGGREASGGICKGAVGHKSKELRAGQNGNTAADYDKMAVKQKEQQYAAYFCHKVTSK